MTITPYYDIPPQTVTELGDSPIVAKLARELHEAALELLNKWLSTSDYELREKLAVASGLPGAAGCALAAVALEQLEAERRIERTPYDRRRWKLTAEQQSDALTHDLHANALERVRSEPKLARYEAFILANGRNTNDEHLLWVIATPVDEILGWVELWEPLRVRLR